MHEASHYITTYRTGEVHGHDAMFKSVCAEIGTDNDGTRTKVERIVEEKTFIFVLLARSSLADSIENVKP